MFPVSQEANQQQDLSSQNCHAIKFCLIRSKEMAAVDDGLQPSVLFTHGTDQLIELVSQPPGAGSDTIRPQLTREAC